MQSPSQRRRDELVPVVTHLRPADMACVVPSHVHVYATRDGVVVEPCAGPSTEFQFGAGQLRGQLVQSPGRIRRLLGADGRSWQRDVEDRIAYWQDWVIRLARLGERDQTNAAEQVIELLSGSGRPPVRGE